MKRRAALCLVSLWLMVLIGLSPVPAALAEADAATDFIEADADPNSGEILQVSGAILALTNDAEETAGDTGDEPSGEAPEEPAPETEPEQPGETPEEPAWTEDGATRAFNRTVQVDSASWQDVNLVREAGFSGKLAVVTDRLTLVNVQIDGKPAEEVDLLDWFELAPKAGICCSGAGSLHINFSALSINKGSGKTLKLKWNGKDVSGQKASWSVSGGKYVKVEDGRITAKKKGTACVTAKYKNQTAVCRLDITGFTYPEKVTMTKSLELSLNNTKRLKAKLTPKKVTDPTITWSSTKPGVVSVDENGVITGLKVGKATITARTCNGKKAKCKVTVKKVKLKSVDFKKLYVTMHPGETFETRIKLKPSNTSWPGIDYTSSDPTVATVDEAGVITALTCGTTTITAVSQHKKKVRNTCKICVIDPDGPRLAGLVIGINPGHQIQTITKLYPLAPGSSKKAYGVKTGATGQYTHQHEYQVVLKVGLKLRDLLEADGATVVMTRTKNDVMLTNIDRARMLNKAGVDVALQLHNDSVPNVPGKTGVTGYIRSTGNWVEESRALCKRLCKGISKATGFKNNGLRVYNDYMSLNWTTTPSVLLEMGYLSNRSDDEKLAKKSFRKKLAQGIYDGLCAYFGR